jgi:hypothetical protein
LGVHVLRAISQGNVFGTEFFLQFAYFLGQCLNFLFVLLLISLADLLTEIVDLAIGLDLSLIATDDADNLLCVRL